MDATWQVLDTSGYSEILLLAGNGEMLMRVEWSPFRKACRPFFRIWIYTRGDVGNGKNRAAFVLSNAWKNAVDIQGLQLKVNIS